MSLLKLNINLNSTNGKLRGFGEIRMMRQMMMMTIMIILIMMTRNMPVTHRDTNNSDSQAYS